MLDSLNDMIVDILEKRCEGDKLDWFEHLILFGCRFYWRVRDRINGIRWGIRAIGYLASVYINFPKHVAAFLSDYQKEDNRRIILHYLNPSLSRLERTIRLIGLNMVVAIILEQDDQGFWGNALNGIVFGR